MTKLRRIATYLKGIPVLAGAGLALSLALVPAAGAGVNNTATGQGALQSVTTGSANTATGASALTSDTTGSSNTGTGAYALLLNVSGTANTGTGVAALLANSSGYDNTATGAVAMYYNTTGHGNTADGRDALQRNTTGSYNSAVGTSSLFNNAGGGYNTALGYRALYMNTTGTYNIAIGAGAGLYGSTGTHNIYIGNVGDPTDNGIIRIGSPEDHARFFAAGVSGVNVGGDAAEVFVNSSGQLGILGSSRAFKEDIHDMGEASDGLLRLRPVTFRYKDDAGSGEGSLQYGLIAEEVAKVYPELVVRSETGAVRSVRYHLLSAMLVNELQKEHKRLQAQEGEIQDLLARLSALEAQVNARAAR